MPNRLLKKPGNGPKRHTGRDEVEIRYPVNYCFFWIPRRRRAWADSGMTNRGCPSMCSALIELRVIYTRSLRSAQSRTASGIYDKRVPSLAAPLKKGDVHKIISFSGDVG